MLGRQPLEELDFEALEMAVRRVVLRWAARWIQDWLNADDSDRRPVAVLCPCGHPARYVDLGASLRPAGRPKPHFSVVHPAPAGRVSGWRLKR